ncbi:MAG: hypothetical protein OES09_16475 [Gammaproteobacteria bacterium]|nr:hypothetical protein [Gammaproteobacteria bacterium]
MDEGRHTVEAAARFLGRAICDIRKYADWGMVRIETDDRGNEYITQAELVALYRALNEDCEE